MNEREIRIQKYKEFLIEEQKQELAKNSKLIESFIKLCKAKGFKISKENFEYISKIGIVANYPNLLNLLNNRISEDKEELVDFDILNKDYEKERFASGYFISDKYMAMANSYFRRGHHFKSAFLTEFLTAFWNFENPVNDKFVSMDFNRVRINVDRSMVMEFDTWFGAKFNKNINAIADGNAKLTPPLDLSSFDVEFCFGNVYSLNIFWYSKGDIKVFQSEEFKHPNSKIEKNGKEYFPAKYVHAEFDTKNGTFRHFDGAIHFYTEDEYLQRRDTDFNHNEKSDFQIKALSQKLFKLNGEIEIKDWSKLTSLFMNNNPLVFEYFEGKLPDKVLDMVKAIRDNR